MRESSPSSRAVALDYLRSSPVRGQLEPYDPRTGKGWRYIQTTDTLNELKVLLPPDTAAMYQQLLKFENYELSKTAVSWSRILEIRHLKDRMIRKCQKLAKTTTAAARTPTRGDAFVFQTFIAPPDFRLKEMETWFRDQQKRAISALARRPSGPSHSASVGPGNNARTGSQSGKPTASHSHHASHKPVLSPRKAARAVTTPGPQSRTPILVNGTAALDVLAANPVAGSSLPPAQADTTAQSIPQPESVTSPRPLPILLRSERELWGRLNDATPEPAVPSPPPEPEKEALTPTHPLQPQEDGAQPIRRRRSCIKRASVGDMVKTVSWADVQDLDQQLATYAMAAHDVQTTGKWQDVHNLFLEQLDGLEKLRVHVTEGLAQLQSETEHLQRVDETIRVQREELQATFQAFQERQTLFRKKVEEALEEATDYLPRTGPKRVPIIPAN